MSESDAAAIINSAAARSRIEVKGVERVDRDPYRTITVVLIGLPKSTEFPDGKTYWVHPRQVQEHLKRFPGSYVIKERTRRVLHRGAKATGMTPKGHVTSHKDFAPGMVRGDFKSR